ncbi:MAG: cyclic nucleotide-binding domain-containing protein [Anaerolineae bacterium]
MKSREEVRDILARVDLFRDLDERDLRALATYVQEEPHVAGEVIWQQGDLGTTFHIVLAGEVGAKVVDETGMERLDRVLGPGESFGETSLLTGEAHEATMEALTDTLLLSLQKEDFDAWAAKHGAAVRRLRMRPDVRRKYEAPHFRWLEPGEVPTLFCRRHPAHMLLRLPLPSAIFAAGCLVALAGGGDGLERAVLGLGMAIALTGALAVLWTVMNWRNDFFMVTNRRVVLLEKVLFISEVRAEAGLEQIQDVQTSAKNAFQRLLGVGTVRLETAGATGQIQFDFVANPEAIKENIFKQRSRALARRRVAMRGEIRRELRRRLGLEETPPEEKEAPAIPTKPEGKAPRKRRISWPNARALVRHFVPRFREETDGVVTWRKHWLILARKTILQVLGMVALLVLGRALPWMGALSALMVVVWLGMLFLLWYMYEDWHNDVYQVAGTRIVDMTQRPLWGRKTRKEGELANIQNVTYHIRGPIQALFNVGDVIIETAGRTENFQFVGVYNPKEVANEIWRRLARFRREQERRERAGEHQTLGDWFEEYARLTGGASQKPSAR